MRDRFNITEFNKRYKTEDDCLEELFELKVKNNVCPKCKCKVRFYKVSSRKCYVCYNCAHHVYPMAGTIFQKSTTNLLLWFYAIYIFSRSKNGVSSCELSRQLGVTLKTAWRMGKQIRLLFKPSTEKLTGIIEADETYVGGRERFWGGRSLKKKTPVVALVQRGGKVIAYATDNVKTHTIIDIFHKHIKLRARVMTDEFAIYNFVKFNFKHEHVNHSEKEYVRGDAYTNTVENFFSTLKRAIRGTHIHVSKKYLQLYVDEAAWRYNNKASNTIFQDIICKFKYYI